MELRVVEKDGAVADDDEAVLRGVRFGGADAAEGEAEGEAAGEGAEEVELRGGAGHVGEGARAGREAREREFGEDDERGPGPCGVLGEARTGAHVRGGVFPGGLLLRQGDFHEGAHYTIPDFRKVPMVMPNRLLKWTLR